MFNYIFLSNNNISSKKRFCICLNVRDVGEYQIFFTFHWIYLQYTILYVLEGRILYHSHENIIAIVWHENSCKLTV